MDLGLEVDGDHGEGVLTDEEPEEGLNLEDYIRDMGKDDVEESEEQSEFESVDPQENIEDLQRLIDETRSRTTYLSRKGG